MLFKVTDIKGDTRWINPTYVRLIRERKNRTEIWVAGNSVAIYVDRPLDEVANVINAALPLSEDLTLEGTSPSPDETAALLTILG
ncbi:MAG: hypothetical protein AAGB51_12640 [Planctomycetota bacterium]